jgi:single-stranded-DNA-specific exonuclease
MKKWNMLGKWQMANGKWQIDKLINLLLDNRGIRTKKEKESFLNPSLDDVNIKSVGIDAKQLKAAVARINKAIKNNEQIVVFGDYDVDGITGAAIIWETLHGMGANILPHIPHRTEEGYGLSIIGIDNVKIKQPDIKLIITVDNGIVAHDAVSYANSQGIDVIITDHHVASDQTPNAFAIVHTTKLCGAGVAYLLSKELRTTNQEPANDAHLELAALGTIADMVPLTDANRTIVKHGLSRLAKTKRLGLLELYKQASLEKEVFTPYEVGYIIAPRLNAAGRIESGMDSLRLLCTKDPNRARDLAGKLELINKERQLVLKETTEHATATVNASQLTVNSLLFVAHETYQQGVIGLVAGRLVEEFYRPAIVLSIGATHTKASARSITGFNLIEFLRLHTDHFINVGGHPMAAGFTVETAKLATLQEVLEKSAIDLLTPDLLTRSLKIDCELNLNQIDSMLYTQLQKLGPFGMGNPEPTFASIGVVVKDFKLLGKEKNHLKLSLQQGDSQIFDAIGFGMSEFALSLKPGDKIDVAYTIDDNTWNGNTKLQLKIRDIKIHE